MAFDWNSLLGKTITGIGEMTGIGSREHEKVSAKEQRDWTEKQSKIAFERNKEEAKILRDWQEKMANTAIQRRREDLEKAGINPILAGHDGAQTPSGAQATAQAGSGAKAGSGANGNLIQTVVNSALGAFLKGRNDAKNIILNHDQKHAWKIASKL